MKRIILFLCLIFIANAWSQSKDVITVSVERQEAKRRTGWTLADWMDTRRTIALQNQWLAFHTYGDDGILYDFYIGGGVGEFKFTGDQIPTLDEEKQKLYNYFGALYVAILGIEYRYEKSKEVYSQDEGNVDLRLFGTSTQTTVIVAQYGLRSLNEYQFGIFDQQFAGGYLQLYIFRFFGLEGRYRNYFWNTMKDGTMNMRSERWDYGLFLEKSFFRIFGTIFQETFTYQSPDLVQERYGVNVGLRINF
ncbi:MAG: hypothetical protein ACHQYQ_10900 [Bacteriovoracales bacterium]